MQEVDWAVGQVMASIKAAGVDNNTVVFFTSDNGAPLGGDAKGNLPRRGGKTTSWEGGYAEPGIVRYVITSSDDAGLFLTLPPSTRGQSSPERHKSTHPTWQSHPL